MDVNYLLHREGLERLRAGAAMTANARDAHLAMADAYRAQITRQRRALVDDPARRD